MNNRKRGGGGGRGSEAMIVKANGVDEQEMERAVERGTWRPVDQVGVHRWEQSGQVRGKGDPLNSTRIGTVNRPTLYY